MKSNFDKLHYALFIITSLLCILVGSLYYGKEGKTLAKEQNSYHPKETTVMQLSVEKSWENCLRKLRIHYEIVFFGNSITRNSDFCLYFPQKQICNLGHGGDDLDGMLRRVGMVACLKPKKIFLMAGINDLADQIPDSLFEKKYDLLVKALGDSLPNSKIYIQSLLPINHKKEKVFGTNQRIDSINQVIKKIAETRGHIYINLFSRYLVDGELPQCYSRDGLHINNEDYSMWADEISRYIYE